MPHSHLKLSEYLAIERTVLANQRTFLAYFRTGIVFFATGVSILKLHILRPVDFLGWMFIVLAPVVIALGTWQARRSQALIDRMVRTTRELPRE